MAINCLNTFAFSQNMPDSLLGILEQTKIPTVNPNLAKIDSTRIAKISKDTLEHLVKQSFIKSKEKLNIKKDSSSAFKNKVDSLKIKATKTLKIKKSDFKLNGLISNQFDYGTVPYYLPNTITPSNIFKSQGDIKISVKNLPLIFSYFYTNPPGLFGIHNYYTLRFDQETYQQNIQNECVAKKAVYQEKLKEAQKQKQEYTQKLAFCESMQGYTNTSIPNTATNFNKDSVLGNTNSSNKSLENKEYGYLNNPKSDSTLLELSKNIGMSKADSLKYKYGFLNNIKPDSTLLKSSNNISMSKADSLKYNENIYIDSLLSKFNADTNYQKMKVYKENIELYEKQIKEYKQAIKFLDSGQIEATENPYLSKTKNFLSNLKKFEIGLCYPNYSTFLINNLTLKGINIGYETKNYFINASYGKTVNNLLSTQTNNNIINSFQNYSNFFDLSKNQDSRKILAGKIGLGNMAKSYLGFGALYGVGNQSYYQSTNIQEKNIVCEVDGKITYKGYVLYASFAKSFLNQINSSENANLLSKNRNNAVQLRFTGVIPYLKTKFSLGYRLVDPFFKSYGVGFIRTDNIRYEAKLEQNISSKLKFGINYRHDEDNILKRYGFKSNLHFLSMSTRIKLFKKRFDIQFIYTPIVQKIENLNTHFTTKNKSDMKNVVLAYTPKFKRLTTTFTGIYNQYTLYDSIASRNMENINISILSIFKNSLKLAVSSSYFDSNVSDSIATPKTILNSFETGYTYKKNIYTSLIFKYSYNLSSYNNQYGAALNVNFPLSKYFFVELHAEKLIVGDFYNSLNFDNLNKFPYYYYLKLNFKF